MFRDDLGIEVLQHSRHLRVTFRAVLADSLYGRNEVFSHHLIKNFIPFVMTLLTSHTWWYFKGEANGVQEQAWVAPAESWQPIVRTFADGHQEIRWIAELDGKIYGPNRTLRLIAVTTDPVKLPEGTTEYLISNLRANQDNHHPWHAKGEPASTEEVVLLSAKRAVIEQAYREVKQHLGCAQYQVRSNMAIQRHWALVCAAFCFLWREAQRKADDPDPAGEKPEVKGTVPGSWCGLLRWVRGRLEPFVWLRRYWRAFSQAAPPRALRVLLEQCRQGHSLCSFVT